jgi:hypothetical protein
LLVISVNPPIFAPAALAPPLYWTRPASHQEWQSELVFLEPLGAPYRPWTRLRSVLFAIAWVALFEAVIHSGHARSVALTVWAISGLSLFGLGLRTLCYQDSAQRMRHARLQPREKLTDLDIEHLRQVPDLYREFQAIQASDLPLLVGDWESLKARVEHQLRVRHFNLAFDRCSAAVQARRRWLVSRLIGWSVLIVLAEAVRLLG